MRLVVITWSTIQFIAVWLYITLTTTIVTYPRKHGINLRMTVTTFGEIFRLIAAHYELNSLNRCKKHVFLVG